MAEWVDVGGDVMQTAQDRLGLSNERLAARLYVVSKTWERWKKRGQVPRNQLPKVAEVLGLEFDLPPPIRVRDAATTVGETQFRLQAVDPLALADWMDAVEGRLEQVEAVAARQEQRSLAIERHLISLERRLTESGIVPPP